MNLSAFDLHIYPLLYLVSSPTSQQGNSPNAQQSQ
jgi:hypothetical protein